MMLELEKRISKIYNYKLGMKLLEKILKENKYFIISSAGDTGT